MNLPPERKLTEQEKSARVQMNSALSQYMQGNKSGALKAFRQALALDPTLAREKMVINLAQELTGLPAQEAFKSLMDADASKDMIQSARKQDQKSAPAKPPSAAAFALIALALVMLGMVVWGIATSRFDNALARLNLVQLETGKRSAGGYDYYVAVPDGEPPEYDWTVVVGIHGMNGNGSSMMNFAENFTNEGAIFIAPTFGGFEPFPGDGPIDALSQILYDVASAYPVQPRAVLLGMSQGGEFAFRFSVYHPEQVYGVVTAGAPAFDQNVPPPVGIPYVFTWGELDGLQDYVIPGHVVPLQGMGYNIVTYIVPGYGHEVTPLSIEQALMMMR
jgi:hypothetical protein